LAGAVEFVSWLHPFVCMLFYHVYMPVFAYIILKNLASEQGEDRTFTFYYTSVLIVKICLLLDSFFLFTLEESTFGFPPLTFSTMVPQNLNS